MSKTQAKPQNPLWQTTKAERKSYYSYFFGQNMIYTMVASFLPTFVAFMIDPITCSIVMGIVKLWDAINDAIFGVIFDKVKFKSGQKFIPLLKASCIITPLSTVALFFIPTDSKESVQVLWFALAYIIWDTAYTLCDVPAFGLVTAMSNNIEERNSILSVKGLTAGIGVALSSVIVPALVSEDVGVSYGVASIIIAAVAIVTMVPLIFIGKERYQTTDEEQFTVRRMVKYVVSNKYLLIYYLGYIFFSGAQTYNSMHQIFAYYIYENSLASLITGTVAAAPQLIMALLVPKIIRKYDKALVFKISAIAALVLSFPILFTKESFLFFTITYMLRSIPLAIIGILAFTFTPDCAEYGQYKTGIEAKGISFAIQTFAVKLAAAISGSAWLAIVGLYGFISFDNAADFAALEKINAIAQQPASAFDGIWFAYNIFPIFGLAIACAIWYFYRLNDKDVQIMTDCNAGKITKNEAEKLLSKKY